MSMCRKHSAWAAGLLLTLLIGSPVLADDVELLLSTPASSDAAKPNILFIIDSSGSMTTMEHSQEPYDPTQSYSGPCSQSRYYWSDTSSVPSCSNTYRIKKEVFFCDKGMDQMATAGSYTDTFVMYYKYNNKWKWRAPHKNLQNSATECKADRGIHGYGANPSAEPYVRKGNNKPPYHHNDSKEVNWGSAPAHKIITVYDPNYLNWFYNPPGTSMRRTDIVKAVTKNVLGSIQDVNVGFMRFHHSQGGPVIHAIKDLDDNRAEANSIVDGIPASGWTPLSETLYESALYWRGMPGDYGGTSATDPDALVSSSPLIYKQPAEYACSKNYVVLLTDGQPTQDTGAYHKTPALPGYQAATGRTNCDGGNNNGACLDDIADYLQNTDINPSVPGQQNVTTYTIGFTVDLPILSSTAARGGGEYYLASDVQSLTTALTDIVTNIFDRDISFTAPAVAVNAFNRTQHLNEMYVSVFRATGDLHWPGNVKKFELRDSEVRDQNDQNAIDPDTGYFQDSASNFWNTDPDPDGADVYSGGAANVLPEPFIRKVYTNNDGGDLTTANNAFDAGNNAFTEDMFNLTGATGEPTMAELIDWARGVDIQDHDDNPDTTSRKSMGDTLHAQPATIVYGDSSGDFDVVLFTATNDGYLHAIDAETGQEKWAFIPQEMLEKLKELFFNENVDYKNYGLDGDLVPIVFDANEDGVIEPGTDFAYIVFGMRRGGDRYYLLDVSNPNFPSLKWVKTFPEFGQTWSRPTIAKVDVQSSLAQSAQDAVLVIGGGYDTVHDTAEHPDDPDQEGAGIYMLDLETGNMLWDAGRDISADLQLDRMTRSIPSQIRVIDFNGDGFADRMYAADLGGQVWRFDITNGKPPGQLVAGGVIASLGAEDLNNPGIENTRRFYSTPDVAMFTDEAQNRRYLSISLGSGYRAHPLSNATSDRFYSLRDGDIFNPLTQAQYNSYDVITDGDLVEVQGSYGTDIPANSSGWKLTLPATEKVLAESRTFNDSIYFVSFEPQTISSNPCQAGVSVNRLYRLNVQNGDPVFASDQPAPQTPEETDEARVHKLEQGGIAPVPVFLFPTHWDDDGCTGNECPRPAPVACVGVECFDPDFPNRPVRTLWTQDGIE
ncbi:MAG: PilC/PilY family type IV pilus protein [Pseudomonadota bacterium]